ncbi:UNVERIFIED_CONTAM: hypothetical protein HDU68_005113 [Siphonaria sp. JEL0065]|nr:hypothetical protein HDU68_005113 [Siphonaria sp. JEL0065]
MSVNVAPFLAKAPGCFVSCLNGGPTASTAITDATNTAFCNAITAGFSSGGAVPTDRPTDPSSVCINTNCSPNDLMVYSKFMTDNLYPAIGTCLAASPASQAAITQVINTINAGPKCFTNCLTGSTTAAFSEPDLQKFCNIMMPNSTTATSSSSQISSDMSQLLNCPMKQCTSADAQATSALWGAKSFNDNLGIACSVEIYKSMGGSGVAATGAGTVTTTASAASVAATVKTTSGAVSARVLAGFGVLTFFLC